MEPVDHKGLGICRCEKNLRDMRTAGAVFFDRCASRRARRIQVPTGPYEV